MLTEDERKSAIELMADNMEAGARYYGPFLHCIAGDKTALAARALEALEGRCSVIRQTGAETITHAHLEELAMAIRKAAYPSRAFTHHESLLCARAAYVYLEPPLKSSVGCPKTTSCLHPEDCDYPDCGIRPRPSENVPIQSAAETEAKRQLSLNACDCWMLGGDNMAHCKRCAAERARTRIEGEAS